MTQKKIKFSILGLVYFFCHCAYSTDITLSSPSTTAVTLSGAGVSHTYTNNSSLNVSNADAIFIYDALGATINFTYTGAKGSLLKSTWDNGEALYAPQITGIFTVNNDGQIITTGRSGNPIYVPSSVVDSIVINNTSNGIIRGGDTNNFGAIYILYSPLATLSNDGTIDGGTAPAINAVSIGNMTLTNTGVMETSSITAAVRIRSTIASINNSGTIENSGTSEEGGISVDSSSTISNLTNSGTISGNSAIYNTGTITNLVNSGTISNANRVGIYNPGTITTLTNAVGGIISDSGGSLGAIYNDPTASIVTFNNAQGGDSSTASKTALV